MDISNHCTHLETVEDHREGTLICTQCCRVIESNLTFHLSESLQKEKDYTDPSFRFIYDSCNHMHVPFSVVYGIHMQYKKFRKLQIFTRIKNKALAAYSIYFYLKKEDIGKSIECVAYYSGIDSNSIWQCESTDEEISVPISIDSIIRANYKIFDLNQEDCDNIIHLSKSFKDRDFSPVTMSATLTWMYCKNKRKNVSVAKIKDVFNCSHMSIYRCKKYVTMEKVHSILECIDV